MVRLAELVSGDAPAGSGTRVMIDLRPLQDADRMPITAAYLGQLMAAFAARPLPGESFVPLTWALRTDPTVSLEAQGLAVAGRRHLPPTGRLLRSAGLTIDPFLLRGAEVGAASEAPGSGSAGALYHTAGGAVPLGSRLPVVATLLDLAAWELPQLYAQSAAARFGHRLRARVLRDAARLIVTSAATAESARRRIHVAPERIVVIPLAVGAEFRPDAATGDVWARLAARFGLPQRYLVFAGQRDARKDLATLFAALAALSEERPAAEPRSAPWPPVLVLPAAETGDASAFARATAQRGLLRMVRLLPQLQTDELAALEAGARGFVYPVLSEAAGVPVLEAIACGAPVIATNLGPLPEIVGNAGILVAARDSVRLAAAIRSLWMDDRLHRQLAGAALARAAGPRRSWHDVAQETRAVYAAAAAAGSRQR